MSSKVKKARQDRARAVRNILQRGGVPGMEKQRITGAEGAGTVLTLEGSDVPIDPNATIDLATSGAASIDGQAHFHTRKADATRPFINGTVGPRTDSPFSTDLRCETVIKVPPLAGQQPLRAGALLPADSMTVPEFERRMAKLNPFQRRRAFEALKVAHPGTDILADGDSWRIELDQGVGASDLAKLIAEPKLGRVQESVFHKVLESWQSHRLHIPASAKGKPMVTPERMDSIGMCLEQLAAASSGVYLLQHDWAGVFAKAKNYHDDGEIALPYPLSIYECRINGYRVVLAIAQASETSGERPLVLPHFESEKGWTWLGHGDLTHDFKVDRGKGNQLFVGIDDLVDLLLAQVRAVLIALEAEAATADVVRAPYKLNQKREKAGKLPLFDYHIVNLAARKKYAPRLPEPGDRPNEHHRKRLHFVSGHWRHFENFKTKVKWHFRGDPDLGFVDKEYRL